MARWPRGQAEVEELLRDRRLQQLTGDAANGQRLLDRAATTLETAVLAAAKDPDSAFVLAYDAARQALTSLLSQQGLRPTTSGGHYAVEQAVRAQFGPGVRRFGALRRRRNELEYPQLPDDEATVDEANQAIESAREIINAAQQILPQLGIF